MRLQFKNVKLLMLAAIGVAMAGTVFQSSTAHAASCEMVEIPIALAPGLPKNQKIAGEHCTPSSPSIMRSVDVLIPGGTYDSLYWDFPYDDNQYSYVDRTLQANRATFNFDRLGTGESSKPLSALVTFDADVYATHQVIQWLRTNRNYNDVTAIGHSMGSIVAVQESALYDDVDRIVATGYLHSPSFNLILTLGGGLRPAILDPQFAGSNLDPGYITTAAGQREKAFYSSTADPNVIDYDEAHKNIVSLVAAKGAIAQILTPALLNNSQKVTVPVFTIVGDQDILCGPPIIGVNCANSETVRTYEKNYFTRASSYSAKVIQNTGHNLPLHPSAEESFTAIDNWIKTH